MINWDHVDKVITDFVYDEEAMRFKTISEFKYCLSHGAEIVIEWNGVEYGIFWDHGCKRYYIGHDSPDTNVFLTLRMNCWNTRLETIGSGM